MSPTQRPFTPVPPARGDESPGGRPGRKPDAPAPATEDDEPEVPTGSQGTFAILPEPERDDDISPPAGKDNIELP